MKKATHTHSVKIIFVLSEFFTMINSLVLKEEKTSKANLPTHKQTLGSIWIILRAYFVLILELMPFPTYF